MDFDFNDFTPAADAVWFNLTNPATGLDLERAGKPVRVALLGPDSPTMVAFENGIQNRRLAQAGKTGRINLSADELEAETTARAAKSLAGWDNFASGGVEIPYDEEKAKDLVGKFRWLRDFVDQRYRDRGNFLGTAAPAPKK